MSARVPVKRTAKLFIGGAFPRSESGRSYEVFADDGKPLAYVAQASRKDLREAVVAARGAFPKWSGMTAYNRGQILYRVAELMEGRRSQFRDELADAGAADPDRGVDAAIDRWVWYAGWADKIAQTLGTSNPVAGPYFNFTIPEPTGVVGIVAPIDQSLLGLVSRLAPAIVGGNTTVVLASERSPLPAVSLAEVLATSDVPGGVVNILTGVTAELVPWLASHMDVNAIDVTGVPDELRGRHGSRSRRQREAGASRPGHRPVRPRGAEPLRDHGAHGVQDRLAPDGRVTGPGLDWREFSALRPDLADAGKQLLYQFGVGLAFLGTVRADGGPRLHPFCPVLDDGLFAFIVPSPKRDDLHRDGRYAMHSFPADENEDAFMLAGTVRLTEGSAVRDRLEARYRGERSQPATTAMDDQDLFEFSIERCLLTRTTGHGDPSPRHVVWKAP